MDGIHQRVILLMMAVLALTTDARKLLIPYPILLVIGGLVLGLIPRLPTIDLDPDLVFLVFLPPILWAAAYFTSWRDFRANLRPITLHAVGLVLVTTAAVAVVAHAALTGLGWAGAIALGAIVSPPDAVSATAVAKRLHIPQRVVTILEGESLVNDATALVLYRVAIAAAVSGAFSLSNTLLDFVLAATLGVAVGLVVGMVARWVLGLTQDSFSEIAITLLAPYIAWVLAEQAHGSAVLACVAGGLYLRRHFSAIVAPATRIQARAVWDLLVFVLNGFIFILIGLQLGALRGAVPSGELGPLVLIGALVSVTAIVVRMLWVPVAAWVPRLVSPSLRARDPMPPWAYLFLIGWTGMRGIVSLAAALALPLTTAAGTLFPFRAEIILITFMVILVTLVLQGLSLPPLIRALNIREDRGFEHEERQAREHAASAVLAPLDEVGSEDWPVPEHIERMRVHYGRRLQLRRILNELPSVSDVLLRAFLIRRQLLEESGFTGVRVVGSRYSRDTHRIREFLAKNKIPFTWIDLENDPRVDTLLTQFKISADETPVVVCSNDKMVRNPSNAQLGDCLGIRKPLEQSIYDLAVVGAGPAGLAAAVYGASDGLKTLILDKMGPGGQTGTSSKI